MLSIELGECSFSLKGCRQRGVCVTKSRLRNADTCYGCEGKGGETTQEAVAVEGGALSVGGEVCLEDGVSPSSGVWVVAIEVDSV